MEPENRQNPNRRQDSGEGKGGLAALPVSLRILEFCKMNAAGGTKWEDTRGATQGQTGVEEGEGEGGGTGPRGSSEFVPNFSAGKRQAEPEGDLGSGKMGLMVQGGRALLGARVPSSPSGFRSDRARGREGRSGELRPLPRGQIRETEGRKVRTPPPLVIWGWGGMRTPFVSVGTCGGGTLPRVAGEAREVLSSSAAEAAAAAATRMDFLNRPNSTVQRCSPQSGGIPPASDAAVAAAPRARLGETNYLVGGGRNGKY